MNRITIGSEAKPYKRQHKAPCHDCPWRRNSIPGWLGRFTAEEWVRIGHGDGMVDCHTRKKKAGDESWQCAGVSIYRANVIKRVDPPNLKLAANLKTVFSFGEFVKHHIGGFLKP